MSKDDFQKVLDGLLRQGQAAPHLSGGSVTSILSKLLAAAKATAAKPLASLRTLSPAVQKQSVNSSSSGPSSVPSSGSSSDSGAASADTASSTRSSSAGGAFDAGSFASQNQNLSDGSGKTVAGATAAQALRILAKGAVTQKPAPNPITNILSKIPGLSLAISPIVSGIIGLFSGHSTTPALTPFVLPSSVRLDGAIGKNDQFLATSQGANGLPKLNGVATPSQPNASAAQQINVAAPALDSRFFLDHSDQIALAVKDAMLHSSSLNDVITDL